MSEEWTYDLFVSYVEADKNWVEGYLWDALDNARVRYFSESAFTLGVPRILEFERAIRQSRTTLLVISETYLGDDLTRFTDIMAQSYGEQVGTWPVIPLTLQDGLRLPPRLGMLTGLKASNAEEWDTSIERLCHQLKLSPPIPAPKPACPYPGMRPFSENDESRFFGRDGEIDELLNRLRLESFLTVIGASGSGKSSLVFAGLISKLKQSGLFGTGQWCIRSFRPGTRPLANLQAVLGGDVTALEVRIKQLLSTESDAQRFLLVVDQLEEVFTQGGAEATTFQETLLRLMGIPNVYLILTVRADFYPDLMGSLLWERMSPHRFEVLPLNTTGLKQAIVKPAEGVDVYVDPVLVERLLVDAKGEPGVLPLIQETLVLLWEKLKRRFLPLSAYELLVLSRPDYGSTPNQPCTGLQVAIAYRADAALADLETEEQRVIARRIFLRLIQFGEGRPNTRRQQLEENLRSSADDLNRFKNTLDHFANRRLLTFSGAQDSQNRTVDIAHEALISGWPTLQQWIAARQEAEQTRRRLEDKTLDWLKLNKKGGLLDIVELEEVKRWLATSDATELGYDQSLTDLVVASQADIDEKERERIAQQDREMELVKEALDKERFAKEQAQRANDQERRRKRLAQTAAIGAYSFSGIILVIAGIAYMQYRTATIKNLETVIATSESLLATDNQIEALLTTVKAKSVLDNPFVWAKKTKEDFREHFWQLLLNTRELNRFQNHTDWVSSVRFSPADGGKVIASASLDGTIQLWELDSGQPLQIIRHPKVLSISFSQDGKLLVSGGMDNILRIWKRQHDNKYALSKEIPHSNWISLVTFNPKSDLIATAGADKTIKIFSQEGRLKDTCQGHMDQVMAVSFSSDGQTIASASKDKTIKIWDLNCQLLQTLNTKSQVLSVRFLDKTTVALGGGDLDGNSQYNIIFWDWKKNQRIHELSGHRSQVLYLSLNKEGNLLGSASEDGTVRVWNLNGTLLQTLKNHNGAVNEIDFSPDSQLVASAGKEKTVQIWKLRGILSQEVIDGVSFSFSPDLKSPIIASGGKDGTLYLWQQDTQTKSWQLKWKKKGHQEEIAKVRFSRDGQTIATVGMENALDGWVKLWDIQGNLLYTSEKDSIIGSVSSLDFSNVRNVIILGYADGAIKRWQINNILKNTGTIKELGKHDDLVTSISVGSDNIIASASQDKKIKLWNISENKICTSTLTGTDAFTAISVSHDNQQIVAGSVDSKVYIFKLDGETFKQINISPLAGHEDTILGVNFSPDGRFIASTASSANPTIKIWSREGQSILTLKPDQDSPSPEVSFSSDGSSLAYSSSEGGIRFIRLDSQELTSLNFDGLIKKSCDWLTQYLKVNNTKNQGVCPRSAER